MNFGTKGEQLKMFMSPREIMSSHQPLDADRLPVGDMRPAGTNTAKNASFFNSQGSAQGYTGNEYQREAVRTSGGTVHAPSKEGLDDMMDRKLEESISGYRHEYEGGDGAAQLMVEDPRGGEFTQRSLTTAGTGNDMTVTTAEDGGLQYTRRYSEQSLYDSVARDGVQKPVSLAHEQFGSLGKPEIVGGHHRLASQNNIDPDALVPVLHHKTIQDARSVSTTKGYKYS